MPPLKNRDSGTSSAPTARVTTHVGMPAADPNTDHGVNTATAARPNVSDPPDGRVSPVAASDIGGQ